MKKLNSLIGLVGGIAISVSMSAQDVGFDWAKQIGGSGFDDCTGYAITSDASGNIYTTGGFQGINDFNAGSGTYFLSSQGAQDVFIQKTDANGNFIWAKRLGSTNLDFGKSIAVDNSGNVYVTGYFSGTVDLDPGPAVQTVNSAGSADFFILKLTSGGTLDWAISYGGTGSDQGMALSLDNSGNVYVAGFFESTVDFDPGAATLNFTSAGSLDVFFQKINPSGTVLWTKQIGSTGQDVCYSIKADAAGNTVSGGYFNGTVDFNPGAGTNNMTVAGAIDAFVLKLDASGNYAWAVANGGISSEISKAVNFDNAGNILVTGTFNQTIDFDPGAGTYNLTATGGGFDMFVQKLDASGNFLWAGAVLGTSDDNPLSIETDTDANVFIGGEYRGITDFDPGAGNYTIGTGLASGFILKLSSGGIFNWCKTLLTNGNVAIINSINVTSVGAIHATGTYSENIISMGPDFNPGNAVYNMSANGHNDVFILKLKPCTFYQQTDALAICNGESYQFGSQTLTTAGIYTETFVTVMGCDSNVTLTLSVNPLPLVGANTTYAVTCPNQQITVTGTGADAYSWSGGVTDGVSFSLTSSITFTVTGTYTLTGCSDTAVVPILIEQPYAQALCVVTVDSMLANHNVVVWEKPADMGSIDSFYVYREITTNNFAVIASVDRDSLSEYHDLVANPNSTSYKYKITTKDSCGNESVVSLYHNSIHLQYFGLGNFQWTPYEIESTPNQVASYNFYRDDNATGNFVLLQVIPGGNTSFTDVNYASFPAARYRVDVNWLNGNICTPTRGAINTSRSNVKSPSSVGIEELIGLSGINIYPVPAHQQLTIEMQNHTLQYDLSITNCLGNTIVEEKGINSSKYSFDIKNLAAGVYFIKMETKLGSVIRKVIVE